MSVHWGGKGPGHVSRWPRGVGAISPYSGATMLLDFLNPVLDPRITFSRGTNATLIDSTGRLTYAPNNTITNSVGPSASTGTAVATVSGAAPDGSNAIRLSKTDATTPRYSNWTTSFTVQGNTGYVASAYFKHDGFNTTVSLEYNNVTHFGTAWVATFNVTASGITANAPSACTSGVQAIGNGWFRVWAAFTSGTPSAPTSPTFLTQITGGAGTSVLVAWGQLEAVTYQTTPSAYIATTASAYYGPRFDYDPVTLAPRGLLIEEARTNSITYSDDWSNAAWSKGGLTVSSNVTASPDGTANADKLAEDTSVGTHGVTSALVTKAAVATTYTYSIYVKAAERTAVQLRIADAAASANRVICDANLATQTVATSVGGTFTNASATITNAANGWFRVTLTGTTSTETGLFCIAFLANPAGTISYTGVTGSGAYLYGAQLEAGSFATSYIPTVASTVTRNADVATMTGTNFSSWYNQSEGTIVADAASATVDTSTRSVATLLNSGTPANCMRVILTLQRQFNVSNSGATQADLDGGDPASGAANKIGAAYAVNDFALSLNGGTVATDTAGTVPTVNTLSLGANEFDASRLNGHIRTIAYFNTRLPNAQLQTLTAPSLATTLSLDFTSGSYNVGF